MTTTPKPPGNWTEVEDRNLRSGVLSKQSPEQVATRLNRLERSVVLRARILGYPFPVSFRRRA